MWRYWMINPYDKTIKWNTRANDKMSLATMVDTYLIEGNMTIPHIKYKPQEKNKSGLVGLNYLYKNHHSILIEMVEIFFPNLLFTPSNINQEKTYEFYLFITIQAIHNVVWYNNIENDRDRGYEKTLKDVENALWVLSVIAGVERTKMTRAIQLPKNKNETIKDLEEYLTTHLRGDKPKKIIFIVKKYFGIVKLTATKEQKMITANTKMKKQLMDELSITEEEFSKIPVIGTLRTKQ